MIRIAAFFIVALAFIQTASAQFNFKKHKVRIGEDVYSIAKEYNTTSEAIINLNPSAVNGIYPDMFLVIPHSLDTPDIPPEGLIFKKHKTKKKHTLYSIAKKYDVAIADIKKYNTFLNEEPLRKGDILRIPLPKPKYIPVVRTLGKKKHPETQIYTVLPKETRYGIARKFGITIPELENMNPNLGENFPVGMKILVPKEIKNEIPIVKEDFELYEVPAKQTMYSLSKTYNIPQDSIITLNPTVKEGLKVGMVLKLPRINALPSDLDENRIDLSTYIMKGDKASIALVLPFCANKFNLKNITELKSQLSKNKITQFSADIYSGAKLAIDKAASMGIETDVVVLDSQKSESITSKLISSHNLHTKDAIIGPLLHKNVVKLAKSVGNVPVFSPISKKNVGAQGNLYQTFPSSDVLRDKMIAFVKADTLPKHILIVADSKNKTTKTKLLASFPKAKVIDPKDDTFIKVEDLDKVMGEKESKIPYWIFLESSNVVLLSNAVSLFNARVQTHKVTLFTTHKNKEFDNEAVPNMQLSNLHFHYPSANKLIEGGEGWFYSTYKSKFGAIPNQYAVRAYDLTLDVILRLAYSKGNSTLTLSGNTTEYLENKFNYELKGGSLQNNAAYIIKYGDNLTFDVLN